MTDAKARLLQMIADEPHMGGGGLLKAIGKAQKAGKAAETADEIAMRLYHGSPHVMAPTPENPLGKFDSSKIGTGEGAQMYGRGHYLAQSRDVAKNYRPRSPKYEAKLVKEYDKAQAAQNYPKMEVLEDAMLHKAPDEILRKYSNAEDGYTPEHAKAAADYAKWYEANRPEVGGLYHVDLPQEYLANMLDYDKPIDQHPEHIKELLEKAGINTKTSATAGSMVGGQEAYLSKHGIPGMAYDDTTGAGTKNFVIFPGSEDVLNIVQRDKKGGAVHMAEGGTPHWSLGNPEQFVKDKAERLYPKHETMNRGVKAVKTGLDAFNALIDQGVPVKDLVGNLTEAIPFVGPDLRKRLESANVTLPVGFKRSPTNPQVATGFDTATVPVSAILENMRMSDLTGGTGASNVLNSVGKGYAPNATDVLDALQLGGMGMEAAEAGVKGARKAAGALSNLAKSEAGYKLAQKALQYAPAAQPMNIVKEPGGNWLGGSVENALKPLKTQRPTHRDEALMLGGRWANEVDDPAAVEARAKDAAFNKWIDSNLTNYVKKQMATPGDPVRKLAEEGITHIPQGTRNPANMRAVQATREAAGFPETMGKSDEAHLWEALSDKPISFGTAGEMMNVGKGEPWMQKVDPFTRVHGIVPMESAGMAQNLGFDHIVDVLRQDLDAGRIRPEQLNKISMEQAVRRTYEFDQDMAKKMRETQAKVTEGMPVHKEYPEGYKWIELTAPKDNPKRISEIDTLLNANRQGGEYGVDWLRGANGEKEYFVTKGSGQNTVYMDKFPTEEEAIARGKELSGQQIDVDALRAEREGLTKEVREKQLADALKYEGDTMGHCVGGYCPDVLEGRSRIFSLRDAKGEPHVTVEVRPPKKYSEDDVLDQFPGGVTDALKQGDIGAKKYIASKLEELNASDLPSRIIQIKGKQNSAPKKEYLPYVQDFVKSGNWSDVGDLHNTGMRRTSDAFNENELNKIREAGIEVPAYATHEEIKSIGNQAFPGQYGDVTYAEGGEVKPFFEEKSAKQRIMEMIAKEPHMDNGPYIGSELMPRPLPLQLQGDVYHDEQGGIGLGGRATYTRPIGRDAAIRAYIEGGGYKPKDMDYKGQVNNIGISYEKEFKDGGEAHMAGGGLLKAVEAAQKTAKAAKAAEDVAKVSAPALIPGLMQKSTAAEIGREERARRQAAAAAEAARVEAAKQTPVPVGYVPHTPKSLNPHVGFRFEADEPVGITPSPTIDVGALERSYKGASMLPLPWDLTNRNVRVSSVSGKKLAHDIWTHGGSPYSSDEEHLLNNIGGASGRGIAERIQGREAAARAENKQAGGTGEILHAVNTMGTGSESYALPSSEFAVDVIGRRFMNGEISLKQAEDLSNLVRNYVDPDTKKQPFKNWGGFLSRDGVQQMYTGEGLNGPPGDLRKLIAKNILYSKKNQELLDFNTEDFVNAITHEPLRGVGRGYIGGNLLSNPESSPMKLSKTADYPWLNPYDTNFSATHVGQLEDLVPIQAVMSRKIAPIEQELLAKQAAKANGKPYTDASLQGSAISALEKRKDNVAQFMDSKFFQDLADYYDALKTPLEKKKGGLARTKKVKRHGNTVSN